MDVVDTGIVRIVALEQTCPSHPSQWEGETEHGASVYVRYRWGTLRVHVGPGIDEAIERDPIYTWTSGDEYDGEMTLEQLRERLPSWIEVTA